MAPGSGLGLRTRACLLCYFFDVDEFFIFFGFSHSCGCPFEYSPAVCELFLSLRLASL